MIEDGTAIGLGLANAVNRLKDSPGKSKVVILLTDGVNNRGMIAPVTAAELAKTYGIRVYTIGVGTKLRRHILRRFQTVGRKIARQHTPGNIQRQHNVYPFTGIGLPAVAGLLLVPMILWYVFREKRSHADLQFSSLKAFKGMKHAGRVFASPNPMAVPSSIIPL